jgi:very-short-patch-repair endonuclease
MKIKKICIICNKKFYVIFSRKYAKYCSYKCYWIDKKGKSNYWLKKKKIRRQCPICKKIFYVYPSNKNRKYCSRQCWGKNISLNECGKNNRNYTGFYFYFKCSECGKLYKTTKNNINRSKSGKVFCSKKCYGKYKSRKMIGNKHFRYIPRIIKKCLICGKNINTEKRYKNGNRKIVCSNKCRAIYLMKNRNIKDTNIEILMEKELKKTIIKYKKQFPLEGVSIVDFYLPKYKIIIQCDGDYWHSKERNKGRDVRQDKIFKQKGYKVFRFLGSKIEKDSLSCFRKVLKYIRKEYYNYAKI